MLRRLKLTKRQKDDAKAKYTRVAKTLHAEFYDNEYDGSTKLLIGSYGKRTNIRPPEDVDLLFKITEEMYLQYENSPSALLQRIRKVLGETYTTTEEIRAWGKVVLVKFADGTHNIELLPAFDIEGVFMIPNTEGDGSWESFDVRTEMKAVKDSNTATDGVTRKLIKILKRWSKYTKTVTIKSYRIEELVVSFLEQYDLADMQWSSLVRDFFGWLADEQDDDVTVNKSQIATALSRASKAVELESGGKTDDACNEWIKVFGKRVFPVASAMLEQAFELRAAQPSGEEMFIEDEVPVKIDDTVHVAVTADFVGPSAPAHPFAAFIRGRSPLPKRKSILFTASVSDIEGFTIKWKIRNFGVEAERAKDLRGKIYNGHGMTRQEGTSYEGLHCVECYVIKNGICVARTMQLVPIGRGE
ncbi:nucleotidyltransferase [Candidatus Saccharibacteria bacterium]|nr:nucleotidyltransferase [Candidatus Saccharibacteria bacterium]